MRKVFALAMLVALTVGVLVPGIARAQGGTPTTDSASSFGVPLGSTVPIIGTDGSPIGTITISNVTDPFAGYDTSSAPQRGYHYALAEVTVSNTGAAPMEVYPNYLMGVDNEGFIAQQPYVGYTDTTLVPLEYTDALAPGTSVTGVIPYQLFGDTTLDRVVYAPTYDRMITALDLRVAPVTAGTTISIIDTAGAPMADVTVNGVTDPFTGYDSSSAPPRGSRFILVDVTVTNTGSAVLSTSPSDFWVVDAEGFVLSSSFVTRTDMTLPDFTYLDLNPGESQHGVLVYSIFESVPPAQINWGDAYTSLNVVADLSAGLGASQPASQPPAATSNAGAPTAAAPPTAVGTTAAVANNPDCAGLTPWGVDLYDRIQLAAELAATFQDADASTFTAEQVTSIANQIRTMGDEQAASNPPAAAVELNTIIVEQFYYPVADTIDQLAAALEQNNMASAMSAMQAIEQVRNVFDEGGTFYTAGDALTAACPAEMAELDAAIGS